MSTNNWAYLVGRGAHKGSSTEQLVREMIWPMEVVQIVGDVMSLPRVTSSDGAKVHSYSNNLPCHSVEANLSQDPAKLTNGGLLR